jgi:segregation and condensation protein A
VYHIHLDQFEGPLDLLLFFIQRDELDVYDIPIARIADEFLAWVRVLEEVDLDGAADFLYMAAVLMGIKARMLLPHPPEDEAGEPVDPRRELVERLLEYLRFKEAAQQLTTRQERRSEQFTRGAAGSSENGQEVPEDGYHASVFDLVGALRRILTTAAEPAPHVLALEAFSVEVQRAFLLDRVPPGPPVSFVALVRAQPRAWIIATFLAVLELSRQRLLILQTAAVPDDFFLVRGAGVPS